MEYKVKPKTYQEIIESASKLFLEHNINDTKIRDIALDAHVGEATIYRYFETKENLVIAVSTQMSHEILEKYFQDQNSVKDFYNTFLNIFRENYRYYAFIDELDIMLMRNPNLNLSKYEDYIDAYKNVFDELYQKDLEAGLIKEACDVEGFYYATTHSLLNLCKKLASQGEILSHDKALNKELEIKMMIDIILTYISK